MAVGWSFVGRGGRDHPGRLIIAPPRCAWGSFFAKSDLLRAGVPVPLTRLVQGSLGGALRVRHRQCTRVVGLPLAS